MIASSRPVRDPGRAPSLPPASLAALGEFSQRWVPRVPGELRQAFVTELIELIQSEQARERRRICTDAALRAKAHEETAEDLRRYAASPAE